MADARKLKDEASDAVAKGRHRRAAELWEQVAGMEPGDPQWLHRAGEAWRRAGDKGTAILQLTAAAEGYARGGFFLKAISVAKMILEIDPGRTETQAMLAALYARRDDRPGDVVQRMPTSPPLSLGPAPLPRMPAPPPPPPIPPPPRAPPRAVPPPLPRDAASEISLSPLPPSLPALEVPRPPPPPPERARPMESAPDIQLDAGSLDVVSLDRLAPPARPPPLRPQAPSLPSMSSLPDLVLEQEPLALTPSLQLTVTTVEPPPPPGRRVAPPPVPAPAPGPAPPDDPWADDFLSEDTAVSGPVLVGDPGAVALRPADPFADTASDDDETDFGGLADRVPGSRVSQDFDIQAIEIPLEPGDPEPLSSVPPGLPRIPLFSSLDEKRLHRLIKGSKLRRFTDAQAIVRQGERGEALYVVVSGQVVVLVDGSPDPVARLREGDFFGELALLSDQPRLATVEADGEVEVLEIKRDLIWDLIDEAPEVLSILLRFFRDRLIDRLIQTSALFAPFSGSESRALAERFQFLELKAGVQLVREGVRAEGLFVILLGRCEVVTHKGGVIATLGPGELAGEISLLTHGPAMASVVARSPVWALGLPRAVFQELILTHPQVLIYVNDVAEQRRADESGRVRMV